MNIPTTIVVGLLSGTAGAIGGVWLLRTFLGAGIEHFFAIALQSRDRVGTSALEFRKQQLAEFYGPIYAYCKLYDQVVDLWTARKLPDIDLGVIDLFKRQHEKIIEILTTKLHLVEGGSPPPEFTQFMTAVTLWNLYTARPGQHWVPAEVEALPQAKFPREFDEYIFRTTEKLKKDLDDLHKRYGIT